MLEASRLLLQGLHEGHALCRCMSGTVGAPDVYRLVTWQSGEDRRGRFIRGVAAARHHEERVPAEAVRELCRAGLIAWAPCSRDNSLYLLSAEGLARACDLFGPTPRDVPVIWDEAEGHRFRIVVPEAPDGLSPPAP